MYFLSSTLWSRVDSVMDFDGFGLGLAFGAREGMSGRCGCGARSRFTTLSKATYQG